MSKLNDEFCGPVCRREKRLREAREFYSVLLAIAGHDLRQPLQVIQTTYDQISRGRADHEQLDRGQQAIRRMADQLDQLVGAMRIYEHAAGMELSQVPLQPLFDMLCRENRELAARHQVDMRLCETTASVVSNPVLLDGVLRNLLQNAIKYTPPGGQILVGCRRRGANTRIDICDTGIGIASHNVPRAFEPFSRLDAGYADGLGLGLFVVQRAVGLLGHRIEVRSRPGSGSRFSVLARSAPTLPRRTSTAGEMAAA